MTSLVEEVARAPTREQQLEQIVRNTLWMARRYAHGRMTYAVGIYNDAARIARDLGVVTTNPDGSIFALDGMDGASGGFSSLSPGEYSEAVKALGIRKLPLANPDAEGGERG